ncbi:peptidoglycan binding protein CsiV [Photobacterium rosenbergii]|uniref:Peptidoglycan binding protein CsiV n=1 Tax=Photobacterium rosenbergii TaxID=294936 RepID=A0ABU3ZDP8_9GAMM|nr:peptidoglycan binding protein CsiV [Photobacterium rosenbergii]MDV5168221.1 peptidoglycan binding protein CsiV [Photobacterium rosenbergii]
MKNLIYLLLFAISWPSLAARQFDIEVILFKRNIAPEQISESWPDNQKPINLKGAIDFGDTARLQARGITPMPSSQFELNSQYSKLKQHAGFTPLAHFGWRQGDLSRAAAPRIHFTAGEDFSAQFSADGTVKSAQSSEPADAQMDEGFSEESLISAPDDSYAQEEASALRELDGTLRVYVQHFLFTEANFALREPSRREIIIGAEPLDPIDGSLDTASNVQIGHLQEVQKQVKVEEFLKAYQFQQQRKMRSGETHYLDHPLMGMVIQIRRIDG